MTLLFKLIVCNTMFINRLLEQEYLCRYNCTTMNDDTNDILEETPV